MDMAHIRGAKTSSARYDPSMTDDERAGSDNIILMCNTHHKLIDRYEPEKYATDILKQWKLDNEPSKTQQSLRELSRSRSLEELLEEIAPMIRPERRVEVDLGIGVLNAGQAMTVPVGDFVRLTADNPHLLDRTAVLVASVRNVGQLDVSLDGVDFIFTIRRCSDEGSGSEFSLMGNNELPSINPTLPHRVRNGDRVNYFMFLKRAHAIAAVMTKHGKPVNAVRVAAQLATGEKISSPSEPWPWA